LAWIRRELDELGIPPLKRLGQHFLIDENLRERVVQLAELEPSDTVLEVGPGLGFLTTALVSRAPRVIAVEKDRTLAAQLERKFSLNTNLLVIQGDVLKVALPEYSKIVSSPPYNISSKLTLLILNSRFKRAVLLLQREFVGRLVAPPGSREYGRLSVMFQCRAKAEIAESVPSSAFYPKPRVDSTITVIEPLEKTPETHDPDMFRDLVRALFTQRRRVLRGVLSRYIRGKGTMNLDSVVQDPGLLAKRVFELTPGELADLSNRIAEKLQ